MHIKIGTALLILASAGALLAWQYDLSKLGLTQKELETRSHNGLRDATAEVQVPWLANNFKQAAKGLSEADRAAAVQAAGAALKAIVTSAAFQKAHNEGIKNSFQAVDHGLRVYSQEEMIQMAMKPKPGADPEKEMQQQMATKMAMELRKQPASSLKFMFDEMLKTWTRKAQTTTQPAAKAKAQKILARAQEIQPWIESKPEEFRKAFSVLVSADNDGPDSEEAVVAVANKAKFEEEQRAYNEHNWKTVLKKKLEIVVKEAAAVDFAAQATDVKGQKKFVNPTYEKKSALWKAMFRAGKAPTTAAAEFSKAWLKEL